MCHFDKCSLKHTSLFITTLCSVSLLFVDQGPFSVVLLCSQMSSAILKGHWLTKKEKKKRNERKVTSTPPLSFQVLPPSVRLNFMNDITGVMN